MAQALYHLRRQRKQCVRCGQPSPVHTQCTSCRLAYNARKRAVAAWRHRHHGPNVVYCCGQAHAITTLPMHLACCGRVLGGDEDTP